MNLPPLFPIFILLLLPILASSLNSDGFSLLALKSAISSDPTLALSKWRESGSTPCSWPGISCVSGRVVSIFLPDKSLSGYIPSEIGFLRSLRHLSLRNNNLSRPIPLSLFTAASSLLSLDLSHNALSGSLPPQIGNLSRLAHLDLSSNALDGSLPADIAHLRSLSGALNLSYNRFSGAVPAAFGTLPVSVSLDLRHNNLSGRIPQAGSLVNQGPTAFAENPNLCGFPLRNRCPDDELPVNPKPGLSVLPMQAAPPPPAARAGGGRGISVPILSGVLFVVGAVILSVWLVRRKCGSAAGGGSKAEKGGRGGGGWGDGLEEGQKGEFFVMDEEEEGVGLELEELLRASAYVVGKSRSGIVYKVVLGRGMSVAVRRLSEGFWRFKEFEAEVEAIGKVRHPNVVRLRAYYYAADEKLLISDFISNGASLRTALHGCISQDA
ncbi:hypothetical protein ACLOJK_018340 [Asimina triloba]